MLHYFTPPAGTTKTVLLTRAERNMIGRQRFTKAFADNFHLGDKVTVKVNGINFRIARDERGFLVRTSSSSWFDDKKPMTVEEFRDFALARLDPCAMARAIKLVRKHALDAHSVRVQKQKQIVYKPNFILIFAEL